MYLQHPWKSQSKIPSVGRFVEADAHQFHRKWMFEQLGRLELPPGIEFHIEFRYGVGKRHLFEIAMTVEIQDILFRDAMPVDHINNAKSWFGIKAADIALVLQASNIE